MNSDILNLLKAPELPTGSYDPNDLLLCDVVSISPDDLDKATHVIVGCPQHIGVERNHGRPGASGAPAAIRQFLYKLKPATGSEDTLILDLGDVDTQGDLEDIHARQEAVVTALLRMGKTVISLGGGNDISFPDASAVYATHPGYAAINMDAHLDMRKNDKRNSGTPYRDLIESHKLDPTNFYEVGIQNRANAPYYLESAKELGVNIHTLAEIDDIGTRTFFNDLFARLDGTALFAGLDMDSVRASDAPGVSASCPVGFSAKTILRFADLCRKHGNTPVFEITEVNPEYDIDGRTARLAALAVYTFIYGNK